MIQALNEPITVKTTYDHKKKSAYPSQLLWQNQACKINKIGLHYVYRTGTVLFHVFAVETDQLYFKLQLNTNNLFWTVEEISDGLPD